MVGGVSLINNRVPYPADRAVQSNGLFRLSAEDEASIRTAFPSNSGTSLNDSFLAFAGTSWRCWPLSLAQEAALSCPNPSSWVEVGAGLWKAMGVEPEIIEDVSEAVPSFREDNMADADDEPDQVGGSAHAAGTDNTNGASSGTSSAGTSQVLAHLHSLAIPTHGGIITHRYSPETLIAATQLDRLLKPGVDLGHALARSVGLLFPGAAGAQIIQDLNSKDITLPSESRLRDIRLRIDLLSAKWEQETGDRDRHWRYINPDSSPQLGWDWLIVREDKFTFPKDKYETEDCQMSANFNDVYSSRTCRISTLAKGHASKVKKAHNISTGFKIESKSTASYDVKRHEVFGLVADEGTEAGIADISNLDLSKLTGRTDHLEFSTGDGRMYPNALYMPEHLHKFGNALENSVKKMPNQKHFLNRLNGMERFTSSRALRRLFVMECLGGEGHPDAASFRSYAAVHVDWRWECLEKAFDRLLPLLPIFVRNFNADKLRLAGKDDGNVDANAIRDAEEFLKIEHVEAFCEMLKVQGHIVNRTAHRLEGCECHASLWLSKASHKRKQVSRGGSSLHATV